MTKTQQIPTDTMSVDKHYAERQAKWVKEVDLKVGDTVLVVANCADFRDTYAEYLSKDTELEPEYIGSPIRVDEILPNRILVGDDHDKSGIRRGSRIVPFYVLIKINE
jgi:hypothetical protein